MDNLRNEIFNKNKTINAVQHHLTQVSLFKLQLFNYCLSCFNGHYDFTKLIYV